MEAYWAIPRVARHPATYSQDTSQESTPSLAATAKPTVAMRLDEHGLYWTATESDSEHAWFYNFGRLGLNRHRGGNKSMAVSVRCIEGQ